MVEEVPEDAGFGGTGQDGLVLKPSVRKVRISVIFTIYVQAIDMHQ